MVKLDSIQKRLIEEIADLHSVPSGAYNFRANSQLAGRNSTANIDIVSKPEGNGIDIHIKPGTKNESVHIPVVLSESGIRETVYNDFYVGADSDVVIVAGCGIDNCGSQDSEHDGIHRFFLEKGAKVRYVEKHYGSGDGTGKRILDPQTEVYILHQRAGSKNVQEVHGTTYRNYCMKCHEKYPYDFIFKSEGPIPKCPKCGGMVRPDVTLYGEGLPQTAWIESKRLVFRADCLIIGGTSLAVQPAASLAYDFNGKYLIIINRDKTFADRNAQLVFHDNITEVLDSINLED